MLLTPRLPDKFWWHRPDEVRARIVRRTPTLSVSVTEPHKRQSKEDYNEASYLL